MTSIESNIQELHHALRELRSVAHGKPDVALCYGHVSRATRCLMESLGSAAAQLEYAIKEGDLYDAELRHGYHLS